MFRTVVLSLTAPASDSFYQVSATVRSQVWGTPPTRLSQWSPNSALPVSPALMPDLPDKGDFATRKTFLPPHQSGEYLHEPTSCLPGEVYALSIPSQVTRSTAIQPSIPNALLQESKAYLHITRIKAGQKVAGRQVPLIRREIFHLAPDTIFRF